MILDLITQSCETTQQAIITPKKHLATEGWRKGLRGGEKVEEREEKRRKEKSLYVRGRGGRNSKRFAETVERTHMKMESIIHKTPSVF